MGKQKGIERVIRSGRLTAQEIARDRELRGKVMAEFPPMPRRATSDALTEALRRAIRSSKITVYEIAKRAGVSQIVISRFLSGERDIRMATADKLAEVLGLELTVRPYQQLPAGSRRWLLPRVRRSRERGSRVLVILAERGVGASVECPLPGRGLSPDFSEAPGEGNL